MKGPLVNHGKPFANYCVFVMLYEALDTLASPKSKSWQKLRGRFDPFQVHALFIGGGPPEVRGLGGGPFRMRCEALWEL